MGARRLALACSVVVCVFLVCLSVSAVALAAPEAPVTEAAGSVGANSAQLNGELNPGSLASNGWYFAYNTNGACLGGGRAGGEGPAEVEKKKVSAEAGGLEPGTLYTYCLVAYNEVGEETPGSTQSFTTSVSQPVIDSESASGVGSSSATLEAQVNPEKQATSCLRFEYGETEAYGNTTPCTTSSLGEGFGDQAASASLSKLKVNETYHFRVVVENKTSPAGGTYGPDQTFATLPLIAGESYSEVGSDSALLSAGLNVYGVPVTYFFEYGTTTGYGSSTSVVDSGAAAQSTTVMDSIEGLASGVEYHFRIVAENADDEVVRGVDGMFKTLPTGIHGLPDERVFEMVTPLNKEASDAYVPNIIQKAGPEGEAEGIQTFRLAQVGANGNAVVYQGAPTHSGAPESTGDGLGSAYLARRSPGGGWTQASIQPPGRRNTGYQGFSSNLTVGVLASPTENPEFEEPQLSGGKAPACYLETHRQCFDLYEHTLSEESYQPLFTAMPHRFGEEFTASVGISGIGPKGNSPVYVGGSSDMGQLFFEVDDALLEGEGSVQKELREDLKQEIAGEDYGDYLYDQNGGNLSLVDVLPDGKVAQHATFGAPSLVGINPMASPPDFSNVISADGSRVFWSALEGGGGWMGYGQVAKALYVRENATQPQSPLNGQGECVVPVDACTVQIDKEVEGGGGRFWTASGDGAKAFFTSKKGELYEYEVNPIVGRPGALVDLTPGIEVQGVIGASENGDYVYYVNNTDELLVLHKNESSWESPDFIARLSSEDGTEIYPYTNINSGFKEGGVGDWVTDMGHRTAEVTPNGSGLVFMSNQRLKVPGFPSGYENEGQEEVYLYEAEDKSLFCASCDQSGEPPQTDLELESEASAILPVSWNDSYTPTWISEDGDEVFFDSFMPLVSRDTNGKLDVYEWEREGTGTCGQGQGTDGGCIYLLSGGTSKYPSYLLGVSANGSDVFIITRADLTVDAQDELFKVFDVRVGGVEPLAPPACTGTGCQGVPAPPPTFATPSSVTYEGIGNFPLPVSTVSAKARTKSLTRAQRLARALKGCKGRPKRRRVSCKANARKRYGSAGAAKGSSGSKRGRK